MPLKVLQCSSDLMVKSLKSCLMITSTQFRYKHECDTPNSSLLSPCESSFFNTPTRQRIYVDEETSCVDAQPVLWLVEVLRLLFSLKNVNIWLVVSTPLKNICQLWWLLPIYGKITNIPVTTNQISCWWLIGCVSRMTKMQWLYRQCWCSGFHIGPTNDARKRAL